VFSGFYGWEQVCNIYTAKGDERFITIGNFDKNETTKFEAVKKPKDSELESISQAYYYVDNVNITLIDKEEDCKCYNNAPKKIEESFSNLIYSKTPELTDKMTTAELKRDVMLFAKRYPQDFMEAVNDPSLKMNNIAARAMSDGYLSYRNNKKEIFYNLKDNKKKLLTIPYGDDPLYVLSSYLQSDEGMDLYKFLDNIFSEN
jgi:hypothetical protein